MALKQQRKLIP